MATRDQTRDGSAETKRKRSVFAVRRMRCKEICFIHPQKLTLFCVSTSSDPFGTTFPSKGKAMLARHQEHRTIIFFVKAPEYTYIRFPSDAQSRRPLPSGNDSRNP